MDASKLLYVFVIFELGWVVGIWTAVWIVKPKRQP